MLQRQMSLLQSECVQDGPRCLPLRFGQNWVINSWDISDIEFVSLISYKQIMKTNKTFPSDLGVSIVGTVTEHLLVWEGEDSALPEWTSGLDVEDEEDQNQHSAFLQY